MMSKYRMVVAVAVMMAMILTTSASSFAAPKAPPASGIKWTVVMDASKADELERTAPKQYQPEPTDDASIDSIPTPGDVRVVISRWTSGYTYFDSERNGTASVIWNLSLAIAGYFTTSAGVVLLNIATIFADVVDQNKGATARLLHSYSYPEKHAEVYTQNLVWTNYFTSQPRQWYRHEYGSYTSSTGYTRTTTKDYTGDAGYSPINTDYSPHYNDNTWLSNEAWSRWYYNQTPGCESFGSYCI